MKNTELFFENMSIETLDGEIWESAFGLDGLYEVSNKGRVKSLGRTVTYIDGKVRSFPEKIIKQCKINHGHTFSLYVRLSPETGTYKNYTVAALVLNSFRRPDTYNNITHHINFCSHDNRIENLTFENFHNKRQMEYRKGIRCGEKTTKHWKENGHLFKRSRLFIKEVRPLRHVIGNGKEMFQQAGKKWPITIWFRDKNEVKTYSSIRNAVLITGMKEYTIRNALYKPNKYKRIAIKKGILNLEEFHNTL